MSKNLIFELVVPAYNEAKNLPLLIQRTAAAAEEAGLSFGQFQLLVVNNGSQDDSAQVLEQLKSGSLGNWFRVVPVIKNQGYGFGLWSGLKETQAQFIGWSHADLQCDPANVFKALQVLREKPSNTIVKGVREGRNWKDVFVSRVFESLALIILGLKIHEMNAQPKVFPRDLLKFFKNPPSTFAFDLYALYCAKKANYTVETIPVLFPPRIHGVSNWASNFLSRYKTILGIIRYMITLAQREGRA